MAADGCAAWFSIDPLMLQYHDTRWCVPVHDDTELFAMLCLEGQQAGLSWLTIIRKEAAIRRAFDGFDIGTVAAYGEEKVQALLRNPEIIRSERKIRAAIRNAQAVQKLTAGGRFASFDAYIWHFTEGRQITHHPAQYSEIPAQNALSQTVSKDMKQHGFSFVGPVIVYSFLQGIGVIDDHLESCPHKSHET